MEIRLAKEKEKKSTVYIDSVTKMTRIPSCSYVTTLHSAHPARPLLLPPSCHPLSPFPFTLSPSPPPLSPPSPCSRYSLNEDTYLCGGEKKKRNLRPPPEPIRTDPCRSFAPLESRGRRKKKGKILSSSGGFIFIFDNSKGLIFFFLRPQVSRKCVHGSERIIPGDVIVLLFFFSIVVL